MEFAYEKSLKLVRMTNSGLSVGGILILLSYFLFRKIDSNLILPVLGMFYMIGGFFVGLISLSGLLFIFFKTRPQFESKHQKASFLLAAFFVLTNIPLAVLCFMAGSVLIPFRD